MTSTLAKWISAQLQGLLDLDDGSVRDLTDYMLSIHNIDDMVAFAEELVYENHNSHKKLPADPRHKFLRELKLQWQHCNLPKNVVVYQKNKNDDSNAPKSAKEKSPPAQSNAAKKKTSYVNLYGKEGELQSKAVMLPGRHACECQAQKHDLINNCLGCGRVVCTQEGSGPCLFCGELVCTREEKEILARKSRKSEKLHLKLTGGVVADGGAVSALEKARAYKERLLGYDKSCAQRTKVIDDESDYYSVDSNIWLNEKERKRLKEKQAAEFERRHGSRLDKKLTLDFAGRRVVEDEVICDDVASLSVDDGMEDAKDLASLVAPRVTDITLTYVEDDGDKSAAAAAVGWKATDSHRVQDEQLMLLSDHGMCLSMHQPWASLLVRGVKLDEGRTWYSAHRGRLWIAATAKQPTADEVQAIVGDHRRHLATIGKSVDDRDLPEHYPAGCLLGCVDVTSVLSQEEYRDEHPAGASASPYVFVCRNARELPLKIPVKGKHKIWKLDTVVHRAARKALHL